MLIKYILIRITPILLLVALGFYYFTPSAAERRFLRMEEAIKKAQSYREVRTFRSPGSTQTILYEAQCPDNMHWIRKVVNDPATPDALPAVILDYEHMRIGTKSYQRSGAGGWQAAPYDRPRGGTACAEDLLSPDLVFPQLKVIRALSHIEKQGTREVHGEKCRDWLVTIRHQNGVQVSYDYCINADDDLPRQIKTADGSNQIDLSLWNQPIPMQEPEVTR